jgi:hypothetical protein
MGLECHLIVTNMLLFWHLLSNDLQCVPTHPLPVSADADADADRPGTGANLS